MNVLASKQMQQLAQFPSYNAQLDVIEFNHHQFKLNNQPINENLLQKVKDWVEEVELSRDLK